MGRYCSFDSCFYVFVNMVVWFLLDICRECEVVRCVGSFYWVGLYCCVNNT